MWKGIVPKPVKEFSTLYFLVGSFSLVNWKEMTWFPFDWNGWTIYSNIYETLLSWLNETFKVDYVLMLFDVERKITVTKWCGGNYDVLFVTNFKSGFRSIRETTCIPVWVNAIHTTYRYIGKYWDAPSCFSNFIVVIWEVPIRQSVEMQRQANTCYDNCKPPEKLETFIFFIVVIVAIFIFGFIHYKFSEWFLFLLVLSDSNN